MGVSYKPSLKEYCSILKDYAISGIASYDSLDSATRLRVERSLGRRIESREPQLSYKFSEAGSRRAVNFNFVPIPGLENKQFRCGFFVPRFSYPDGQDFCCAFCILLWIDNGPDGRTVSFRLEPPDRRLDPKQRKDSPHFYSHIQLSRNVRDPNLATSLRESWIPDSYPAFPIYGPTPIGFFAAVATSVHGYNPDTASRKFAAAVLTDAVKNASRAKKLVFEIDRLLAVP